MPVETYSLSVLLVDIDFAGLQFFYGIRDELPADALSPAVIMDEQHFYVTPRYAYEAGQTPVLLKSIQGSVPEVGRKIFFVVQEIFTLQKIVRVQDGTFPNIHKGWIIRFFDFSNHGSDKVQSSVYFALRGETEDESAAHSSLIRTQHLASMRISQSAASDEREPR